MPQRASLAEATFAGLDSWSHFALQSNMTVDDRRLSDTAVDILGHLMPNQGVEHQQVFSRDSLGILPTLHGEIHA